MKIINYIKPTIWVIGYFLFSANSIAAPIVSFGISDNDIQIHEAFTIDVLVSGVEPFDEVIAFGFDLILDPTWSLDSVMIGSDFDYDDSAIFPNTDVAGSVDFFNIGPSGDDILLASLQLSASSAGDFNLGIFSDLFDFNEGLLLFPSFATFDLTHTERVTIQPPSPVPAPGTLLLFSSALLSFLGYKKIR